MIHAVECVLATVHRKDRKSKKRKIWKTNSSKSYKNDVGTVMQKPEKNHENIDQYWIQKPLKTHPKNYVEKSSKKGVRGEPGRTTTQGGGLARH